MGAVGPWRGGSQSSRPQRSNRSSGPQREEIGPVGYREGHSVQWATKRDIRFSGQQIGVGRVGHRESSRSSGQQRGAIGPVSHREGHSIYWATERGIRSNGQQIGAVGRAGHREG